MGLIAEKLDRLKDRLEYVRLGQGLADKARLLLWALASSTPRRIRNSDLLLRIQSALVFSARFRITPCGRPRKSRIRVGWVADHFYPEYLGGAEITDHLMIRAGEERGYEIVRLGKEEVSDYRNLSGLDFLIVSNTHTFSSKEIRNILRRRYVLYLHDCVIDPHTPMLLRHAGLVVFLSPLHRRFFEERFRISARVLECPPPVEIEQYDASEKEDFAVYAGLIAKHKGIYNVLEYARKHPSMKIILVGKNQIPDLKLPENVEYLGVLSRKELLKLLSRARYFIHLPEWVEAFGRAVAEAYLCGCELITNDRVGFLSYPWNFEDRESVKRELAKSRDLFWDAVISVMAYEFYSEEGRRGHYQKRHYSAGNPRIALRCYMLSRILCSSCVDSVLKRVLDVGCAEGLWCLRLAESADLVVGMDISGEKLSRAYRHPRIDYVQASWDYLPFRKGAFDLVTAFEVLEHSKNPDALLKSLLAVSRRVLASLPVGEPTWRNPLLLQGHLHAFDYQSACNIVPDMLKRAWCDSYTFYGVWER